MGGHAAVKRWTKAVDLFLYDLILVPLHLGVHWAMAVSQTHTESTFISLSGLCQTRLCELVIVNIHFFLTV